MATGKEIAALIESFAPRGLAEDWDNSGWQLGDPGAAVKTVLLALDVDQTILQEAREKQANLILCHHPLFMKGIKNIRLDEPKGALVAELLKNNIAVYAAHTNLDSAVGGVNELLAARLGLSGADVLQPARGEKYYKLAVFVPAEHTEAVQQALAGAGAGWIGNYSDCTFQVRGTGTFRPRSGSHPFIGEQGELARVEEIRLETIVPAGKVKTVLAAMLAAHPYEEVAYDLYALENRPAAGGLGRIGNLANPKSFADLVIAVKEALGLATVKVGGGMWREVRRVAVCGGAGGELWPLAAAQGADVFITGDIKYHTAQDMLAAGLNFIDAGHFATEHVILPALQERLTEACRQQKLDVVFILTKRQSDPFMFL
ncbi:Nif3-like dinuclear metal center hexameric protein [Desulforamulus hydrothermalis]|uniref:GTP cyclohydrolase 1 type 2 homolog n=1 Tax=Desulforamulus hydrothermalis Lam5 = DSM 18033 TaxID=1121428 RepID=K8E0R3_9FIRM|nr:Nif3-like dinuclear metal center hexameric protein [Desulforamulus hydrothermalis]CCO09120.1 conserved hypothetical protein [Desulforamulus hydrothermalis Lam5 = DSM 18033]SHH12187.1 dinuclear metal center protein, YbgI/SA1388 family [Desulforamulus hydrothermalis Lam5 = DSM 18033]